MASHKLLNTLPAPAREKARAMQQWLHIDTTGWRHSESPSATLSLFQESIWSCQKVTITYAAKTRLISPLGLVVKGKTWYLVALNSEGEPRTFRLDRIEDAQTTQERFTRPPDFDLAAYWTESTSTFRERLPQYVVTVKVSPKGQAQMRLWSHATVLERSEPDEDGWVTMRVDFEGEENARFHVRGMGGNRILRREEYFGKSTITEATTSWERKDTAHV
ncbi:WYL domain-containing protein [Paenibacillus tianmuensis]|uniref:WYL domain-containing protein n=1 Tax=Paenibacillus tianmuensis TaxID=624147 RepID=A0A1G4QZP9_9BACL|nr:WYL domain-containing protein [Paenibacillus tianmuensis]SCW49907.1 WYL domain-containing protein [Paenibacillus tianmuensis]